MTSLEVITLADIDVGQQDKSASQPVLVRRTVLNEVHEHLFGILVIVGIVI